MALSANKGDWSEFYAFLKILSDKKLYSADEALALIPDSFVKVLSIIRNDEEAELTYELDELLNNIVIKSSAQVLAVIPIFRITGKLAQILAKIKEGSSVSGGSFEIPDAQDLMADLRCKNIKSSSSKKSDISLEIEDPRSGTNQKQGFSIKSKIGGLSTLFNASGATNFEYEIINGVNSDGRTKDGALIDLNRILGEKDDLQFSSIPNENFRKNLMMIDSKMPEIVAEMVKAYYLGISPSVVKLTQHVQKSDPLNMRDLEHFYEYKVREFLFAVAFGMKPSKVWDGLDETHGGYIVVKENGELACYHLYDRDRFRKFLFMNTKFDTPSKTRHKFGRIYERDGRKFIKLNLQIRFKN